MKLLNIHNAASQYRAPLFIELGKRYEQQVCFFQPSRSWREPLNALAYDGYQSEVLQGGLPRRLARLAKRVFLDDYDVLLMTVGGRLELCLVWLGAALRRKPFVLWEETWAPNRSAFHRLAGLFLPALYRRADAVLALGSHVRRYLQSRGVPVAKIIVAPQLVDAKVYAKPVPKARAAAARKAFGLKPGRLALLYVGRMVPEKGLATLMQALALPEAKGWDLVLCGRGPLLDSLVGGHALAGRVHSLGHRSAKQLIEAYAAADCLVLPSVSLPLFKEPWGLVVNEAFCQGLPALTSDAVGAAAGGLVRHRQTGWIVPEGDVKALALALDALGSDRALRKRLGAAAKRRVLSEDYQDMADRFGEAFELALEARGPR